MSNRTSDDDKDLEDLVRSRRGGSTVKIKLEELEGGNSPSSPQGLGAFIQKHVHREGNDAWTYNSLARSAQDFIDSAVEAFESQAQQPAKPFIYISEDEFDWRSKSGDLNGTRSLTCITPQHFGEKHYGNFTVPLYLQPQAQQETEMRKVLDDMVTLWFRTHESGCLPMEVVKAQIALRLLPPAPEGEIKSLPPHQAEQWKAVPFSTTPAPAPEGE